ncbi:unnamed protein product [Colias eurytheme]|nr:unnamed protein product [Colias eurytheme]
MEPVKEEFASLSSISITSRIPEFWKKSPEIWKYYGVLRSLSTTNGIDEVWGKLKRSYNNKIFNFNEILKRLFPHKPMSSKSATAIKYVIDTTEASLKKALDSNVFASILIKHLKSELDKSNASRIILWSDGCCYQNRSVKLANALLELAVEKNISIEQKFLEVGHTQMEVDSVHSSIERKLPPHREIFLPADYINIIKSARKKDPYNVIFLNYDYFLKYDGGKYTSIRPGNKKGDPVVTDICALQYLPEGKIKYRINFEDDYEYLPRRISNTDMITSALYTSPLPIELTKFIHLQEMKPLIPNDCHPFSSLGRPYPDKVDLIHTVGPLPHSSHSQPSSSLIARHRHNRVSYVEEVSYKSTRRAKFFFYIKKNIETWDKPQSPLIKPPTYELNKPDPKQGFPQKNPQPGGSRAAHHQQTTTESKTVDMLRKQQINFKAFHRTVRSINLDLVNERWEFEDLLSTAQSRWAAIDSLHWELSY